MATVQLRNDSYRVLFLYHGKRHTFTLGKVSEDEAYKKADQVDYLLLRLKQKLIAIPAGVSIEEFLLCDGQIKRPEQAAVTEAVTFARFKEKYLETQGNGAMEENSLDTVRMHLGHFEKTLGERFPVRELSLADLQRHVNRRRQKLYRGKPISTATLRMEMSTLRAAWNWGVGMGLVAGRFPNQGLVYPKTDEKPPFMTRQEIERKVALGGLTEKEKDSLWECLYLTQPEIIELLDFMKANAAHGWIFPAIAFAAHTGARRSELLRLRLHDIDLDGGLALIHEKKRSKGRRTTRRVPLSPFLKDVLLEWLKTHPGGPYLFCHQGEVPRSKKRSGTTGHLNEKVRPKSLKGRLETVRKRETPEIGAITRDEAHDHFRRTVEGSKWDVLRGYHVLRHSFISLAASRGVDQRLIDEWVGHQTEEQRKRYRHLLPSVQQQAISSMFEPEREVETRQLQDRTDQVSL